MELIHHKPDTGEHCCHVRIWLKPLQHRHRSRLRLARKLRKALRHPRSKRLKITIRHPPGILIAEFIHYPLFLVHFFPLYNMLIYIDFPYMNKFKNTLQYFGNFTPSRYLSDLHTDILFLDAASWINLAHGLFSWKKIFLTRTFFRQPMFYRYKNRFMMLG